MTLPDILHHKLNHNVTTTYQNLFGRCPVEIVGPPRQSFFFFKKLSGVTTTSCLPDKVQVIRKTITVLVSEVKKESEKKAEYCSKRYGRIATSRV
jgi:hypothetical protein